MKFPAQKLSKGMEHLRIRAPFVLLMGAAALFSGLSEPAPPPKSTEGVAEMLGRSVGAKVAPDDFVWEQRGGFWKDAFWGRSILFLASKPGREGEPASSDLYRAKVRLTRAGRPISIHSIKNLSKTPLGQERDLKGLGNYIAFTTLAFDSVQGISILDLSGDYGDREAKSRWQSFKTSLENFVETGSFSGLGRIELAFGNAPAQLYSELSENTLWISPDNPAEKPRVISLDLKDLALKGEAQKALDARVQRIPHPLRPFSPTLLALSEMVLGERAEAYLQAWLFSLDASEAGRSKGEKTLKKRALWPLSPPSEAFEPAISEWGWPPASITLPIASDIKGEGLWMASASALLPERKAIELRKPALELQTPEPPASDPNALDAGVDAEMDAGGEIDASLLATPIELPAPAPLFYQSQYRPDPAHPESTVLAIAMDMRQLELHIEAGYDEPRPVTGPRGSGRLPRGALASRVVAAFIGGKPKGLPELGMVVKGRILVPPTPNAPSILIERRGHAFVGPWLFENALPPGTLSMRQSPLWLLQNGARPANPLFEPDNSIESNSKELKTIKAADFLERSALCLNKDGHFIYFFAPEIDEQGLSKAAFLAGCQHALHLGAPPSRAGFALVRADPSGQDYEAELISPLMSASPDSFTQASANEIWYFMRRQNNPSVLAPEGGQWEPESAKTSIPPWLPAVYTANTKNLGAEIKVYYLAPERFAFRLLAGSRERTPQKGTRYPTALPEGEEERAALVFGLGVGRRKGGSARGLATSGTIGLPIRKNAALLLTGNQGLLILRSEDLPQSFEGDATELAMTADEGKILPEGRKVGMRRERACICVLEDGSVLVAHTIFDSDEAATEVLLKAGCERVAGLDRGSQGAAFIERVSPSNPLKKRYEASILVAVDLEMKGRAQPLQ